MQIFVADKGFVKVYPMKSPSGYKDALKAFAKKVGAPEMLVANAHPSHMSQDVRAFCNKIGTTLRILEQFTQWVNYTKLYVGLTKEAVQRDVRLANPYLVIWDYCAEQVTCFSSRGATPIP